jgi:hypothetical protein
MPDLEAVIGPTNGDAAPPVVATDATPTPESALSPSPPPPPPPPPKPRIPLRKRLRTVGVRVYAGTLTLGIGSVCTMALVYLFRAVFTPAALPLTFAQWQGRLDAAALRQDHIPGITTDAGRAPTPHYHKVDRWFAADPRNACTLSGCHSPLPHSPKSRIAVFPNLHVTFLDCRVCHEPTSDAPIEVRWISTATGRPQEPPPVLRLIRLLDDLGPAEADARAAHPKIVALLKEMDGVAGREVELDDLLVQIDSSVPHSPFWRKSVDQLRRALPLHARGEYGAKLTRDFTADNPKTSARLARDFLAAPADGPTRKEISKQLHRNLIARPAACPTCHTADRGRFNFLAAGYSPKRAEALRTLPLARMIEQIRAGESFQLPKVMEAGDGK